MVLMEGKWNNQLMGQGDTPGWIYIYNAGNRMGLIMIYPWLCRQATSCTFGLFPSLGS